MKGYTMFNAERSEELPAHYTAKAEPPALTPIQRIDHAAYIASWLKAVRDDKRLIFHRLRASTACR